MNIQILGLSHKSAPIEIRERVSFSSKNIFEALDSLKRYGSIEEGLILSTCNRVELYLVVKDSGGGFKAGGEFLSDFHRIEPAYFRKYLYLLSDREAISHLFRVASSLDSMVIGEAQIFGQLKEAYMKARQVKSAGRILSKLFDEAIRVGKKIRTETRIGVGAVSVSSAAIALAKKIFGSLEDKKILIIGAGKIAELAVENLYSQGVKTVLVANRTFTNAQELARIFGGTAIKFEGVCEYMKDADIIISSTSAPHFIIKREQIEEVMRQRNQRPLFLIDLGLPRNISPDINFIDNVHLYNIDDLGGVCNANIKERLREARKAEQIIEKHLKDTAEEILQLAAGLLLEAGV